MHIEQGSSSYFHTKEQIAEKNCHPDLQDMYGKELRSYNRLSQAETTMLARIMQRGVWAEEMLEKGNGTLSHSTHIRLEKKRNRGEKAQRAIVTRNLPLVIKAAQKTYPVIAKTMSFMDCIAEGNCAFLEEVKKFDPDKGRLSTYIIPRLQKAMKRASINTGTTIRIPVWLVDEREYVCRVEKEFVQTHNGRRPTDEELASILGCSVKKFEENKDLAKTSAKPISAFEEQRDGDAFDDDFFDSYTVPDIGHEEKRIVEDKAFQNILIEEMEAHIASLPDEMQRVIRLRFGLDSGEKECSFKQMANQLRMTQFNVEKIYKVTLALLQKRMISNALHG